MSQTSMYSMPSALPFEIKHHSVEPRPATLHNQALYVYDENHYIYIYYIMIFSDELNICYTEERAKGHVLPLSQLWRPRWALRMKEIHSLTCCSPIKMVELHRNPNKQTLMMESIEEIPILEKSVVPRKKEKTHLLLWRSLRHVCVPREPSQACSNDQWLWRGGWARCIHPAPDSRGGPQHVLTRVTILLFQWRNKLLNHLLWENKWFNWFI